jgi:hypothetical protein
MKPWCRVGVWLVLLAALTAPLWAADRDSDAIADEIEMALGMDPGRADKLTLICDDKSRAEGDQTMGAARKLAPDLTQVWFGNVAGDRYVWRLDFAERSPASAGFLSTGTVLILYLDADNDRTTGRQDGDWVRGCDIMLTCVNGGFSPSIRNPAVAGADQNLRGVVDGKSVYFCMDLKLNQTAAGQSEYRGYVLCHRSNPTADADTSVWFTVTGPGVSPLAKPRIAAVSEARSEGVYYALPWMGWREDLAAAKAITLDATKATLQGMRHYDRALVPESPNATATFTSPVAGSFHVGVVIQDSAVGEEIVRIKAGGRELGRLNCLQNDGVFHLFTTREPVKLAKGAPLTLTADTPAQDFQISEVLLLPQVVEPRPLQISHVETFCPPQPAGRPATVEVCFLTNMPCVGQAKWGSGRTLDQQATEATPAYNHRLHLTGLTPGRTYRVQAVAGEATSPVVTFVAAPRRLAQGTVTRERAELTVLHGSAPTPTPWPVSGGVPFARGAVGETTRFRLLDRRGAPLGADFRPLATWPDGSMKWLEVSTLDRGVGPMSLEYGTAVPPAPPPPPGQAIAVKKVADGLEITNGPYRVLLSRSHFSPAGTVWRNGRQHPFIESTTGLTLTDAEGKTYTSAGAPADKFIVEQAGPVRAVVLAEGKLVGPAGSLMGYRCRLSFWAGFPGVPMVITLINDHGTQLIPPTMTEITSLALPLTVPGAQAAGQHWLQDYDDRYVTEENGQRTVHQGHGPGVASLGGVSVTIKDFWQLFPKAFTVAGDSVTAELFPPLPADQYAAHTDPKLLTQNYFWASKGKYKLPCGSCPSTDLLVYFGERPAAEIEQAFGSQALLATTPERYCSTQVLGDLTPVKPGILDPYNHFIQAGLQALEARRQRGHEYSWINYGDWYGERSVNWGNLEYDLPWGLLLQFARSGNHEYFDRAEQAARHSAAIDTVTASPRADQLGLLRLHCIGHTGGFGTLRVPDAVYWYDQGWNDVGHTYSQGNFAASLVSGDPRYGESARLVSDWIAAHVTASMPYHVHRNYGWGIITMMGAYDATANPYYLNAARLFADYVIARQDPGTGVWAHPIGECEHTPQHMGGKVFMSGVVMTGLKLLDQIEPSPALKHAILRNCDWMHNRMWHEDVGGFEYAQCPQFARTGPAGGWEEVAEGLAYAYQLAKRPTDLKMLMRPLSTMLQRTPSGFGKDYAMLLRTWSPAVAYLDRWGYKQVTGAPPGVQVDSTVYLPPGQARAVGVKVTNSGAKPLAMSLQVLTAPAGVQVEPRQFQWQAPPGGSYAATVVVSGVPADGAPLRVQVKAGDDAREVKVTVRAAQPLKLGTNLGYIGAEGDPLGQALQAMGRRPPLLPDLSPETLSAYGALIVGCEAFDKNYAGLHDHAARLLDFVHAGGKVALFQLQDTAHESWHLPAPLLVSDDEGTLKQIEAGDPLFNRPSRIASLAGAKMYDTLTYADRAWRVRARDDRGQPAIVATTFGRGSLLVVQASLERYVTGALQPEGAITPTVCREFLENVLVHLGG